MKYKNTLNQIKALLSIEVKLEQMKLVDGVTVVEAEQFAPEFSIGIVTPDGVVPMTVGVYELEDGKMLSVEQDGIIAKVEEKAEEAKPEDAAAAPAEVQAPDMEAAPAPKRVVESVSKETFFEEMEKLKAELIPLKEENERLKAELAKVELAAQEAEEEAAAPIAHNPEAEKVDLFKFSANRAESTMDRVYTKLFN